MATASLRTRSRKPTPGDEIGSWGANKNAGTTDTLDEAWAVISVAVNADVTLTVNNYITDEARSFGLIFTGAGGFTVTAPAVDKPYLAINNCAADVTLTPQGGTGAVIRAGTAVMWYCDGTNGFVVDTTLDKIKAPAANLSLNSKRITNLATPSAATDGANKGYVDTFTADRSAGGFKLTNLADATDAGDAVNFGQVESYTTRAETAATNAEASEDAAAASETDTLALYSDFQARYLGPFATEPTEDNEGNPLQVGALYFNSVGEALRVWTGSNWIVVDADIVISSQAQAEAGTDNTTLMTPLRVAQANEHQVPRIVGMEMLGDPVEAAGDAAVDILLPSGYEEYVIKFWAVLPSSDAAVLQLRTSSDGGGSFDAGATNYSNAGVSSDAAQINTAAIVGNAANEYGAYGEVRVFQPSAAKYCGISYRVTYTDGSGDISQVDGAGRRNAASVVNAVRCLFSAGNIASGKFQLYGVRTG